MPPTIRRKGRPKAFDSKQSQNTIQSLDRALEVLEALATGSGLTLTEVAETPDQSPATMYRVLSTLEARDFFKDAATTEIRTPEQMAAAASAEALPEVEDEWDPFEEG